MLDEYTRFLLYGSLREQVFNTPIDNHGLTSNEELINLNPFSYALISANTLASDVFVQNHDWTFEIAFIVPDNWVQMLEAYGLNTVCLFGNGITLAPGRFDNTFNNITGQYQIGAVLINAGSPVSGYNTFTFQRSASGEYKWRLNDRQTGTRIGEAYDMRSRDLYIGFDGGFTSPRLLRYGYPMKIRYIRISNCLRIT